MRASHKTGVERDQVHEITHAQALLQEPARRPELGQFQGGIDEKLDRVIARLAVDVHGAGKIRRKSGARLSSSQQ